MQNPLFDVVLMVVVAVTSIVSTILVWAQFGEKIQSIIKSDLNVEVRIARHEAERGSFFHEIRLRIFNQSSRPVRVTDVKVYDNKKREMSVSERAGFLPHRQFEIDPETHFEWFGYYSRQSTGETRAVKLKVCFERPRKKSYCVKVRSEFGNVVVGPVFWSP